MQFGTVAPVGQYSIIYLRSIETKVMCQEYGYSVISDISPLAPQSKSPEYSYLASIL